MERSPEELREALRSGVEESERLTRLAEDLLLLAPAAEGTLPLRPKRCELQSLLTRVAARFAARAAEQNRRVAVGASPEVAAEADPALLEQALGNLVENALRYGEGTIRLLAVAGDHEVELHVTNEGPGFPPAFLERAFERFSRAEVARGRGGVGVGLAIVAAIANAHGGNARAENRPEGGADVSIALPGRPTVTA